MTFTNERKLACLEREINQRRRVYARLVREGIISETQARTEIAIMEAIANDYRAMTAPQLPLTTPTKGVAP